MNGQIRYIGNNTDVQVDKLEVYTLYKVKVTVCGEIDCTSTTTEVYTGELPPEAVVAPQVNVLGNDRVGVQWLIPVKPNGVITGYEVFRSTDTSLNNLVSVFNTTSVTNNFLVNKLTPGTTYYFRIKAYTAAGGTLGDASAATTLEDAPSGIPPPTATPYNSTTILVRMFPPASPNGVITEYKIIQNSAVVMKSTIFPTNGYVADGLRAFSKHVFRAEVCTSKGCGSSDSVTSYTEHGAPKGTITLSVSEIQNRTIDASWNELSEPNGEVNYTVYLTGEFYALLGAMNTFETTNKTEICYSGEVPTHLVRCVGLLPNTRYEVQVNGSNNAGYVLSNKVEVSTQPDGKRWFTL